MVKYLCFDKTGVRFIYENYFTFILYYFNYMIFVIK